MSHDVEQVDGAAGETYFDDDESDVGNDDEENDEKPRWNGGMKVRVTDGLIVAEKSTFGSWNEVEFENGEQSDGDHGQDHPAGYGATTGSNPSQRHIEIIFFVRVLFGLYSLIYFCSCLKLL